MQHAHLGFLPKWGSCKLIGVKRVYQGPGCFIIHRMGVGGLQCRTQGEGLAVQSDVSAGRVGGHAARSARIFGHDPAHLRRSSGRARRHRLSGCGAGARAQARRDARA
jgi:hypothetical protein